MASNAFWKGLGTVGGGIGGFIATGGNPMGAMAGSALGGTLAGELAGPDESPWANYQPEPMPEYVNTYNPNDTLSMSAQQNIGGIQYGGQQDINNLRSQANKIGPSAFTTLAQQDQAQKAREQMAMNRADVSGQAGSAMSNLRAGGGASSGARERIGMTGQKALIDANQKVGSTLAEQNRALAMGGEATKQQQLQALPGMENQAFQSRLGQGQALTNAKQYDIAGQRADALNMGQRRDQEWAARQQINALKMGARG